MFIKSPVLCCGENITFHQVAKFSVPLHEDSSGCYPVCIKNPDIMDNTTASITGRSLFIIRA
ncbi:hypothetical protein BON91_10165 [Escherichia coli]|nr:hypothetical protein BON91_10165 [Escherichia coli]